MAPDNFDGWTNVGRVRVQEGNTEGAKTVLLKALALKPNLPRANFFYARVLKEEGHYDEAAQALQSVLAQFPAIASFTTNSAASSSSRNATPTPSRNSSKHYPSIPKISKPTTI